MKSLLLLFLVTSSVTFAPHREENETDDAFFTKTFHAFPFSMQKIISEEIGGLPNQNNLIFYNGENQQEHDYDFEISSFQEEKIFLKYYHQTREIELMVAQKALIKLKAP